MSTQNWKNVLGEMELYVNGVNRSKGWFDTDRTPLEDLMLIVTEVAEAAECVRNGEMETTYRKDGKMEGFASELADILIRLLDTSHRYNVDLAEAFIRKMTYNESREYRHGGKTV